MHINNYINKLMIYQRKVPNKNKHSNRRYHYVKKNGKWKPKHPFESQSEAERFIKKYGMINYVAYLCPYCCKWHIGREFPGEEKAVV